MISWSSKRQSIVTLSTTKAEFVSAAPCACQVLWLRNMLHSIGYMQKKGTVIYCDNMSTIKLSKNLVFHKKSKHIDVKFHFLRDLVNDEVVKMVYCNTDVQVADILTKPLKLETYERLRKMLGMYEISNIN